MFEENFQFNTIVLTQMVKSMGLTDVVEIGTILLFCREKNVYDERSFKSSSLFILT